MDETVKDIMTELTKTKQDKNTLLVFISDNGAREMPRGVKSSNFPLRGYKGSVYEGGTKVPAFIYSPDIKKHRYTGLFHSVDLLPTILAAANISRGPSKVDIDGLDQWEAIKRNTKSPRISMA